MASLAKGGWMLRGEQRREKFSGQAHARDKGGKAGGQLTTPGTSRVAGRPREPRGKDIRALSSVLEYRKILAGLVIVVVLDVDDGGDFSTQIPNKLQSRVEKPSARREFSSTL